MGKCSYIFLRYYCFLGFLVFIFFLCYTGFLVFNVFTGYTGFQGFQGFTGFQGSTLAWWNSYEMKYDTSTINGTGITDGFWRAGTNLAATGTTLYEINETNFEDINLEKLVEKGVITKQVNVPSAGFTTYKLIKDISMNLNKTGWQSYALEHNFYSGYVDNNSYTHVLWDNNYDILQNNYFDMKEGYIFDGNGHTIEMNHDIGLRSDGYYDRIKGSGYGNYYEFHTWELYQARIMELNFILMVQEQLLIYLWLNFLIVPRLIQHIFI